MNDEAIKATARFYDLTREYDAAKHHLAACADDMSRAADALISEYRRTYSSIPEHWEITPGKIHDAIQILDCVVSKYHLARKQVRTVEASLFPKLENRHK